MLQSYNMPETNAIPPEVACVDHHSGSLSTATDSRFQTRFVDVPVVMDCHGITESGVGQTIARLL